MIDVKKTGMVLILFLAALATLSVALNMEDNQGLDIDMGVATHSGFNNLSDYCSHTELNISACQQQDNNSTNTRRDK